MISKNTCVLIPAYNPDNTLIKLIKNIQTKWKSYNFKKMPELIIVNDGSYKEESIDTLKKISAITNVRVINSKINVGKGAAIKLGLEIIKKKNIDFFVTADADGQHSVNDIYKVLNKSIEKNKFIIGQRTFDSKTTPFRSMIGNKTSSYIFYLCTGKFIKDTQSGLRAFPKEVIEDMLLIEGSRYEYELKVLLNFFKNKDNYTEIESLYFDNNIKSSFRPILDSIIVYSVFIRYCFFALCSTILDFILIFLVTQIYPNILSFIFIRFITSHLYFILMKYNTFKVKENIMRHLFKFYCLLLFNIFVSSTIFNFLYFTKEYIFIIGYLASVVVLFFINFFLQRKIIFT